MNIKSIYICVLIASFAIIGCKQEQQKAERSYTQYEGSVFGTYYRIKFDSQINFKDEIDSIFSVINGAANSYVGGSEITTFNQRGELKDPSSTFLSMIKQAQHLQQITGGYFEPALYPVIKAWRFGEDGVQMRVDTAQLDSLKALLPMEKSVQISDTLIMATRKGAMIDLSAMGEGYAIERIHKVLQDNGVENYMIEIGGEIFAKGKNEKGKLWTIGIEDPSKAASASYDNIITKIKLNSQSISTSGSYRKFYTDEMGHRYPHIIDPKTAYPVKHHMVSVSVIAASPLIADVFATACMAMGADKAKEFISADKDVQAFMAYYVKDSLHTWNSSDFYRIKAE